MFRLDRIDKAFREAGSFNAQVNLFGFIDDQVFLTKSGDTGVVLEVRGVDYECLEGSAIDNLTKRLESAFRIFDEKCRVYQYLFKANGERAHLLIPAALLQTGEGPVAAVCEACDCWPTLR